MKTFGLTILLVGLLALIMAGGCSKNKEVSNIEKQMMGETTATAAQETTTTTAPPPATMADTTTQPSPSAAAVPQEEATPAMPSRPAGSGYEVQVAGCEDATYAQHLVNVYRNRGYEPYVTTATIEGQKYYRVRLGIFQTLAEAKKVAAEIEDRYSVNAWIDQS